ncbi:MAG: hypothetical protein AAGC58_08800 [Asticcacaulis sp.]
MTDKDKRSVPEPSGKESGHNAKETQKLKPEWKKRPEQYPEAGEQLGKHDTGKSDPLRPGS